jgi:membrane-associated protease RseP (regulator of RpoE activity)
MRDTAGLSPKRKPRRPGLIALLSLFLAPLAAMLLLLSHSGTRWLDRRAVRPHGAAILPGLTVEAAPSSRRRPDVASPIVTRIVVTSIQSGSPAARRGIAVGDAVVAIDGARIFSLDQARRYLQKDRAETVAVRVAHGRELRDIRLARAKPGREGDRHGPQAAGRRG